MGGGVLVGFVWVMVDFVWVVVGCDFLSWWWLVASLGLHFLKIDFLHPRSNTRNKFLV